MNHIQQQQAPLLPPQHCRLQLDKQSHVIVPSMVIALVVIILLLTGATTILLLFFMNESPMTTHFFSSPIATRTTTTDVSIHHHGHNNDLIMYYNAQQQRSNHHRRQHDNDDDHSDDDIVQLMNHQQHSSLLYWNSLPLHLTVNTNQTDNNKNNNGTSNDEPSDDVVLDYLVDTCDIITWVSLFIYLLYLLIRTLVTFPYRSLLNVFVTTCCAAKNKNKHSDYYSHQYHFYETNNNKNSSSHSSNSGGDGGGGGSGGGGRLFVTRFKSFMSDMTSSCYLFARPIARLVFLLLISDWLVASTSIVNLIYNRLDANVPMRACRFQAFMTQFFGLNTYCWLFVISVWMFYIVVLNRRNHLIVLEIASHVFAWSVSIVFTVIPFAAGAIESNGASYCWISGKTAKGRSLILIAYYIPLWIFMILITCTCLIACVRLIRVQYLSSMGTHASSTAGTTTTSAANASPFNTTTQSRIHVKSHPHITHAYLDDDETLNEEYVDDDFEESEYDSGNNRMMAVSTINGGDDIDLHSVNIDDDELTNTTYRDKNIQNNNNNRKTLISHVRISLRLYIKLLGLPIVFVLIWIAPSVRRIKTVIGNGVPLSLEYAHNISAALQGFLFVVVIVLSDVIGYWNERRSNKCCGLCCSKRRKRQRRAAKVKNHSKLLGDTTYDQSSEFISSSQPASETHYSRFT